MSASVTVAYLDGDRLSRALRAGIANVVAAQRELNDINVFPVPDGDTGTNMAHTLVSAGSVLQGARKNHCGDLLNAVADAALDGARGNSGAILAQFLQGVADTLSDCARASGAELADALVAGAEYARSALGEPMEGTILSVITDTANAMREAQAEVAGDIGAMLASGLAAARVSLEQTRTQLEAMRKANVVDAGGKGFVLLLEGIANDLADGSLRSPPPALSVPGADESSALVGYDATTEHRYCTECIVTGSAIDRRRLRETLAANGSSLVVAGTVRKTRIHIHTDAPEEVFRVAEAFGTVGARKADDMQMQAHIATTTHARVAIVADTGADIPDDVLESMDIHVVPLRIQFGDRSHLDKVGLTGRAFFENLATSRHHPQTSQPAPGDYRRMFEFLASHYDQVIAVSLTRRVSGTWQAATNAAKRVASEKITVFDTRNASLGQGLLAIDAARCAAEGFDTAEIISRLEKLRSRTSSFAVTDDLSYAVRGGRIRSWMKSVADFLRVTPVLRNLPDGRISVGGALLGRPASLKRFAAYVARRTEATSRYRVAVAHGVAQDRALELARRLRESISNIDELHMTEVGAALGVHGGPGLLVVAIQEVLPFEPATETRQQ
jgi:DegV family protein with EDD domain